MKQTKIEVQTETDKLKRKRELLNIKLGLIVNEILNNENKNFKEDKEVINLQNKINKITKIIKDNYIDIASQIIINAQEEICTLLTEPIKTKEEALERAEKINEMMITEPYFMELITDKENLIAEFINFNKEIGYTPQDCINSAIEIRLKPLAEIQKYYINQVLYNLTTGENPTINLNNKKINKLSFLRSEIKRGNIIEKQYRIHKIDRTSKK